MTSMNRRNHAHWVSGRSLATRTAFHALPHQQRKTEN